MAMSPTRMTSSRRSDTTTAKSGEALHLGVSRSGAQSAEGQLGEGICRVVGVQLVKEKIERKRQRKSFIV